MASVIVVRAAGVGSPERVLATTFGETSRETVARHFPGAIFDSEGGFDLPDTAENGIGGGYVFDCVRVDE
ncbi:hypothetical protein [Prescottella equi]|uniref:hypothetical protein n=1 Tax=Rhodococcus hoagii TaxID=43767 RepID=UPI000D10448A|nr:hypothetical protein [Prescottella equi]AVP71334.1 hypothetical protein C7H75_24950 [Prescottella equi]